LIVAQEKTCYHSCYSGAAHRPEKHRRKGVPGKHKLILTGLVAAAFALGVMVICYYAQVFALGYQIQSLKEELALLRVENYHLAENIYRLTSLDRVEHLALNRLGMVNPDNSNILVVAVAGSSSEVFGPEPARPALVSAAGDERSRLIQTFSELVNRLENKIRLGLGLSTGSEEVTYADDQHIDAQTDSHGGPDICCTARLPDDAPGLDTAG